MDKLRGLVGALSSLWCLIFGFCAPPAGFSHINRFLIIAGCFLVPFTLCQFSRALEKAGSFPQTAASGKE